MASEQTRSEERYTAAQLTDFSTELLKRSGIAEERARCISEILVEGDLMGHTTHGIQLLSPYLKQIEAGTMTKEGDPEVIKDDGAAFLWDGGYLPGPWLVIEAMETGFERVKERPVVTAIIRRSHHIGCLAAYLKRATDRGLFMILTCSDPSVQTVAPFGGIRPVYTPNPFAIAIPTEKDPILIDISMSATANGLVMRLQDLGQRLPHPWLLDSRGRITDEPSALFGDPPGSILPLGGEDLGYKGFALGIFVEALTSALAGHGRVDEPTNWGANIFIQIINPESFGGREFFLKETHWFSQACLQSPPKPGASIRLPGQRALAVRAEQLEKGIVLYRTIMPGLQKWSERYGVPLPTPIGS
jgi:L-lactate dehydrogenase